MKKIVIIILIGIFCVGCSQNKEVKKEKKKENIVEEEKVPEYVDDNIMPISLYYDRDVLVLAKNYKTTFKKGTDIGLFQIYPATEEKVSYEGKFGEAFYKKWNNIDKDKNYKMGYHIEYELDDGTKVSHYVYNPDTSMTYKPYIKVYLYDDYAHRNDSWYSHIEKDEYNDNTYLTSIKLTPGTDISKVSSSIILTAFTYNGEDDFDENGNYRGISKYSITICNEGKSC